MAEENLNIFPNLTSDYHDVPVQRERREEMHASFHVMPQTWPLHPTTCLAQNTSRNPN